MVDLHTHSTASDGTLTPTELVEVCRVEGVTTVALTDHDTIEGVEEAAAAGAARGVTVIAGIELEIEYAAPGAFHLLGLGLTRRSSELTSFLSGVHIMRQDRNARMVERMRAAGIAVHEDEIAEFAGGDVLARPHFAQFLVERGIARSIQEAFDRFLGDGKLFYEPKGASSLEEAAAVVHSAGGVAVVAHPKTLFLSISSLRERLREWKTQGLDGVEAYHSNARLTDCRKIEALAREEGLMVSAGSDYHGPQRADRRLGRTAEGIAIEHHFANGFSPWPMQTSPMQTGGMP